MRARVLHSDAALPILPVFLCSIFFPLIRLRFLEMSKSNPIPMQIHQHAYTLTLAVHTNTNTSARRTQNTRNI